MTYRGIVENGVVVFKGGIKLPEGTPVRVEPLASESLEKPQSSAPDDPLFRMDELAVNTGIVDLATNLDHYLYGHPKVSDGQ